MNKALKKVSLLIAREYIITI